MAAVSQKIQNLIGGVSEQPDSLKLPGQLRSCTNYYPDPTFGLSKRPGVRGIKNLDSPFADGSWFTLIRDDEEKYICQVDRAGSGIKIWDADSGIAQTVNTIATPDLDYLDHDLESDISVLQINDFVFLLNRSQVVRALSTTVAAQDPWAFTVINTVAYNSVYRIKIDSTNFTYTTPSTVTSGTQPLLSANDIVTNLTSSINANANYSATAIGRYIYIKRVNNAEFTIEASGGQSGNAIESFKGTIPSVAELPTAFQDGIKIRVLADKSGDGDDYWLQFKTESGANTGSGVWEETVAPGAVVGIDPLTMPHAIIREANGTFTFRSLDETTAGSATVTSTVAGIADVVSVATNTKGRYSIGQTFPVYGGTGLNLRLRVLSVDNDGRILTVEPSRGGRAYTASDVVSSLEGDTFTINTVVSRTETIDNLGLKFWEERQAGDDETNPMPSFVDQRVTGLAFFKNRLVFMSGENVICSEAGQYFNFFASTMLTFIDSDPIDLSCGSLRPIELRHSLQTPQGLIIFADNAQYILQTTTDAFSASTAEINLISSYSQSPRIAPVDLGPTLVFIEQAQISTTVYEMLLSGDVDTRKPLTAELSRTVPSFIPADIRDLKGTSSASTMALLSGREPKSLYLFRFYNAGNERQFASWFKWEFPGDVVMFEFDHDVLYIVLRMNNSNSQLVLGTINLLTESPGGAIAYEGTFIDVRLDLYDYNPTLIYSSGNDTTRICFKPGFHDLGAFQEPQAVLISDNEPGVVFKGTIEVDLTEPAGQQYFLEIDGDQTSSRFALGYGFTSEARLPALYVESDGRKDTLNIPTIHRVLIDSYNSGPFQATIETTGRNTFTVELPQIFANQSLANVIPVVRNAQNRVPILAKGDDTSIILLCPYPFPVSLTSLTWEGTYNNRGVRSI
jgi:hypothetical protein